MIRPVGMALVALAVATAPAAARTVPQDHVDKVIAVFLSMDCAINPIVRGEEAERRAGLSTREFSQAVAELEDRGQVTTTKTLVFRLKHKDCP